MLLWFLCVLGLVLLGWSIFDLVRDDGARSRRREIITLCSVVVSLLLYFISTWKIFDLSTANLSVNVFSILGIVLTPIAVGWFGGKLADDANRPEYLNRVNTNSN